ncbi:MAG: exonuclease domain-containing protein [Planctomycetes bacterium]|nr:exonuclease domain-containing protein [Planctomycetota bacterium]
MMEEPRRFLVVDLEATCWEREPPAPNEIIEIGAVLYEAAPAAEASGVKAEFQTFVKPVLAPVLSGFCRQLTQISQEELEGAPPFPAALERFAAWAQGQAPYLLSSWGNYDRKQLEQDCRLHRIPYPFTSHLNLKREFALRRHDKPCGMAQALRKIGIALEGTHHRGLDDARNIARILHYMIHQLNWRPHGR